MRTTQKKKKRKSRREAVLFLGRDTNHRSLLQRCEEKCLRFPSCYHARLLEWVLNLGEKVVPSEDIGLSALSRGHEVEEATDDKVHSLNSERVSN